MAEPLGEDWSALVQKAKQGDRDAFARLVAMCQDDVQSFVRERLWSSLRPKVDSSDVVQSTIRQALTGLERLEDFGPVSFKAWILRLAERRLSSLGDRFFSEMRDIGRERLLPDDDQGSDRDDRNAIAPPAGPATWAGREEERRIIRECIECLDEPYRTVLLADLDGLTSSEIGRKLDKPATTIRTLRVRARTRLAPLLRAKLPSWPPGR